MDVTDEMLQAARKAIRRVDGVLQVTTDAITAAIQAAAQEEDAMAKKKSEIQWRDDKPVTLYVRQETYAEGREEFSCFLTPAGAVEDDGPTSVGVYRLVEVRRLQKRVESAK